ncbi:hypothetical protein QCE92_14380, partial [Staphylococcus aureus]|nr:hypothetical protein [Staphylococcus aureus]
MIYIGNIEILTAKSAIYLGNVGVNRTLPALPIILMMAASLSSCSAEAPAAPADPVTVLTMRVAPTEVTAADELPGRVVAFRTAEIRPQVGGIVQRRLFEQGAAVRAGQMLFQISPAPFRADADTAQATVQKAGAAY